MCRTQSRVLALPLIAACSIAVIAQTGKPPQTRQLRANGANLSYVEQGKGTPVVFAHGGVTDLRFWEPQREAFAKGHRFIALTHRYHGTAPWSDEGKQYSAHTHAADLAAFIEGLNAGPVDLVGLSYGGVVAAMVATRHPQLIRTLTLAEPPLFALVADLPDGKAALEVWNRDVTPGIAALKAGDNQEATRIFISVVTGQPRDRYEKLPAPLRQMHSENARTLSLMLAVELSGVSCEELGRVKAPTLLVRGQRTPEIFVKANEAIGRCMPGSRPVVIPDASHGMSYDNPTAFNRAVLEFVAKQK